MPDLIPVDHDPFNDPPTNLIPVDHDPWENVPRDPGTNRPLITIPRTAEGVVAKPGQTVQNPDVAGDIAAMPNKAAATVGDMLGINDAMRAIRGELTPEEAQTFAMSAATMMLGGPEAKAAKVAEEAAVPLVSELKQAGIRAYHGSPYDFNQFDLSKIGTGEGAQAYGHGLYFAENPATAQAYREILGRGDEITVGGQPIAKFTGDYYDQMAAQQLRTASQDPNAKGSVVDAAIAKAQAQLEFMKGERGGRQAAASAQKTLDRLNQWKEQGVEIGNPGKTYEVNINADPEHFLDWDKPLSEHPPEIQDKVKQAMGIDYYGKYDPQKAERVWNQFGNAQAGTAVKNGFIAFNDETVAQRLRDAGIPGIKYLDQGSRPPRSYSDTLDSIKYYEGVLKDRPNDPAAQQQLAHYKNDLEQHTNGTRNYVVFNDKLIDIVKKYGLAGLVAGGASHFSTQPVDHNPFE